MERKLAFVFPGQGSQYVGMGKNIKESNKEISEIFRQADEILGKKISQICFEGPQEELNKTINTQPAIFTINHACFLALKLNGVKPDIVAGHSLGEYNALVAAEVFDFNIGMQLVAKRAKLMEKTASKNPGKMIAVLGLGLKNVNEIVKSLKKNKIINVANYNCPGQIVVSGENSVIEKATQLFKQNGAKRVVELAVSGGFHSGLMREAQDKFYEILKDVKFKRPKCKVVSNYTGEASTDFEVLKNALSKQITGSVQWERSVNEIESLGVKIFVEVGPKKVLTGLVARIDRDLARLNVENVDTLISTISSIKRSKK